MSLNVTITVCLSLRRCGELLQGLARRSAVPASVGHGAGELRAVRGEVDSSLQQRARASQHGGGALELVLVAADVRRRVHHHAVQLGRVDLVHGALLHQRRVEAEVAALGEQVVQDLMHTCQGRSNVVTILSLFW